MHYKYSLDNDLFLTKWLCDCLILSIKKRLLLNHFSYVREHIIQDTIYSDLYPQKIEWGVPGRSHPLEQEPP